ncbi:hypothetical protein SAMN05414139_07406 [Burkholderia sp. D7]|nr:hypothetical protein SAMN05414139_07406 [Burkholderia sp. D7]
MNQSRRHPRRPVFRLDVELGDLPERTPCVHCRAFIHEDDANYLVALMRYETKDAPFRGQHMLRYVSAVTRGYLPTSKFNEKKVDKFRDCLRIFSGCTPNLTQ